MGADIHIFAEIKKADKWLKVTDKIFGCGTNKEDAPFDWRSYGMFGFLADVRNYSHIPPLGERKGLPGDSEYLNEEIKPMEFNYGYVNNGTAYTKREEILKDLNYHSHTYYTLKELLDFDYSQAFEDLRYTRVEKLPNGRTWSDGAAIAEPGKGTMTTFREFLNDGFFDELEVLKTLGAPDDVRIVFWFDN